jgi:acetolactate synthase regulatory subunit
MEPQEAPSAGYAEVHVVAASPEDARRVAEVLRRCFAATEQRGYPASAEGGTRLELTVDTTRAPEPVRSWLESSVWTGHADREPGRNCCRAGPVRTAGLLATAGAGLGGAVAGGGAVRVPFGAGPGPESQE